MINRENRTVGGGDRHATSRSDIEVTRTDSRQVQISTINANRRCRISEDTESTNGIDSEAGNRSSTTEGNCLVSINSERSGQIDVNRRVHVQRTTSDVQTTRSDLSTSRRGHLKQLVASDDDRTLSTRSGDGVARDVCFLKGN